MNKLMNLIFKNLCDFLLKIIKNRQRKKFFQNNERYIFIIWKEILIIECKIRLLKFKYTFFFIDKFYDFFH